MHYCYKNSPKDSLFGITIESAAIARHGIIVFFTVKCGECGNTLNRIYKIDIINKQDWIYITEGSSLSLYEISEMLLRIGLPYVIYKGLTCGEGNPKRTQDSEGIIRYTMTCRDCSDVCKKCASYQKKSCYAVNTKGVKNE